MQLALPEILLILTIALLVFGPKRLPEMGRTIGKGLREMRSALDGVDPRNMLDPDPVADDSVTDSDDAALDQMIEENDVTALDDDVDAGDADPDAANDWPDESPTGSSDGDADAADRAPDASGSGDEAAADTA